jgi:hypothetical protein
VITDASAKGSGSTTIGIVNHLLLDSYDLEPPFAQRRLTVLSAARCGERTDWFWVAVDPPLEYGPRGWLPGMGGLPTLRTVDVLALAARHEGASLEKGPWPVHVYVCRAKADETLLAAELSPDDIAIEYWGTVTPTEAPAASDRGQGPRS